MRLTRLVVGSVLLAVSLASAQWLEKTVYVPDTLSGFTQPQCIGYNSANGQVYVGGYLGACVIAISCSSNQKVARIATGNHVYVILCDSQNNRTYATSGFYSGDLTVIDGATDQIVATVTVGDDPHALCLNPQGNKVYWSSPDFVDTELGGSLLDFLVLGRAQVA